jgi:hypothetical protein
MANSLLDFVMSLVRDPDAAARYAADPAGTIADAHLTDVTSVDVNNLIPVVSESLSMGAPVGGVESLGAEPAGNVWASGAATAAFDAFDDHAPVGTFGDSPVITEVIDQPDAAVSAASEVLTDAGITAEPALVDTSPQFDTDFGEPATGLADEFGTDWGQPLTEDHQHGGEAPGFDLFD